MHTQSGAFTGVGGLELFYQGWLPDSAPKARVIICHGLAEHGGRYAHVAAALTARGFAVWVHDHRGHGRSEGLRGYVERFDMYVEDMHTFIQQEVPPAPKTFMYGHSFGSVVTLPYVLRFPAALDGIILTGTALSPGADITPAVIAIVKPDESAPAPVRRTEAARILRAKGRRSDKNAKVEKSMKSSKIDKTKTNDKERRRRAIPKKSVKRRKSR